MGERKCIERLLRREQKWLPPDHQDPQEYIDKLLVINDGKMKKGGSPPTLLDVDERKRDRDDRHRKQVPYGRCRRSNDHATRCLLDREERVQHSIPDDRRCAKGLRIARVRSTTIIFQQSDGNLRRRTSTRWPRSTTWMGACAC